MFAILYRFHKQHSDPRHAISESRNSYRVHTQATLRRFRNQSVGSTAWTITVVAFIMLTAFPNDAPAQCQLQKITADDGVGDDEFGRPVAVSGDTAIIGASGGDDACPDDPDCNSGSAYVYEKLSGVWTQTAKLTADDGARRDFFGVSVSVSGDTAIIGASGGDDACPGDPDCNSGSAYVFEKVDGVWMQIAKLTADDAAAADAFSVSVSVSDDMAVIGARFDDDRGRNSGSAYVFEKIDGVWTQTAKLTADDGDRSDYFGISVSLNGDTAVIGAFNDDDICPNDPFCFAGSAYVFEKIAGFWTQSAKLTAADGATGDVFGGTVSVSGDTVIIGAEGDDDACPGDQQCNSGSAYVFQKISGIWTLTAKLTAHDRARRDFFGASVSVSGDTAIIGARLDDDACLPVNPECNSGSVYVFEHIAGVWTQTAKLTADDGEKDDVFGYFVTVSGNTTLIGAFLDDDACPEDSFCQSGSAYFFALGPDCNNNDMPDACDIRDDTSEDVNGNGVPDECDPLVTLDIRPGGCPNPLNVKSRGVVPMAIVSSESFDVMEIDIESLVLSRADGIGGVVVPLLGPRGPGAMIEEVATPFTGELCACHELNGDGIYDLALKFSTSELVEVLELDSLPRQTVVTLTLSGSLFDGTAFAASDCITIVNGKLPPRAQRSINKLQRIKPSLPVGGG